MKHYEQYKERYKFQLARVLSSGQVWVDLLKCSAYNYKLPFDEQVQIYSQRQDTTALLEFNQWGELYQRRIKSGAKGLSVIDPATPSKVKYYFDVTDTYTRAVSKPVRLWEYTDQYDVDTIKALTNLVDNETHQATGIESAITVAAKDLLAKAVRGEAEDTIESLSASTVIVVKTRLGINLEESDIALAKQWIAHTEDLELKHERARLVFETSKALLKEITGVVKRQQINEILEEANYEPIQDVKTSMGKEQLELDRERGTEDSGSPVVEQRRDSLRNQRVGDTSEELSHGTKAGILPETGGEQHTQRSPSGNSRQGGRDEYVTGGADAGKTRAEHRSVPVEHAEMDSGVQQHSSKRSRDNYLGNHLQLDIFDDDVGKEQGGSSTLPSHQQQGPTSPGESREDSKKGTKALKNTFTEDINSTTLNNALIDGLGKHRIKDFQVHIKHTQSLDKLTSRLKLDISYHGRSYETTTGKSCFLKFSSKGCEISLFEDVEDAKRVLYTWPFITKRLVEINKMGLFEKPTHYMTSTQIDSVDSNAIKEIKIKDKPAAVVTQSMFAENSVQSDNATTPVEKTNAQATGKNHSIDINSKLGEYSPKERYKANVAAIKLTAAINNDERQASVEEQKVLANYTGWGAIQQVFDKNDLTWQDEFKELKGLLTEDEYEAARASVLTAFYTPPQVIDAIYKGLEKFGFTEGKVLEPSCGTGNFFGVLPKSMAASDLHGVELDPLSAQIARQLYPNALIHNAGYEDTIYDNDTFDVAIGNVPFGNYQVSDSAYNKYKLNIHDYFFVKSLDKVRPGGIVAFITSSGTLDKQNSTAREHMARRADLLGAVRLPNTVFKANAGTLVTADIVFLQKRVETQEVMPAWTKTGVNSDGQELNNYFIEHPEQVCGTLELKHMQYGRDMLVCSSDCDDIQERVLKAVQNINASFISDSKKSKENSSTNTQQKPLAVDIAVRDYSYIVKDDEIYFVKNNEPSNTAFSAADAEQVKSLIKIRDLARAVIETQLAGIEDSQLKELQQELNTTYDDYITAYKDRLTSIKVRKLFQADASYPLLCALEITDAENVFERKAEIFARRTLTPTKEITSATSALDALAISLEQKGRVDVSYMARLCNHDEQKILEELDGKIYRDPAKNGAWVTADEYLSGNVRNKLTRAHMALRDDKDYIKNVDALKQVTPEYLHAEDIAIQLGATWIDTKYIKAFIDDLLETTSWSRYNFKVHYVQHTSSWVFENRSLVRGGVNETSIYGTKRMGALDIIESTLNLKSVVVRDKITDSDGKEKFVINKRETAIAREKQEQIKEKFKEWIYSDPYRKEELENKYNNLFNSWVPRVYDGSILKLHGSNKEIQLREHQLNAVARIVYGKENTLLGHVVGAGKTFEIVGATQELKRLGIANKPLIVVPNHLTGQWAQEYLTLYPAANILVATKKDFQKQNRKEFCTRIATGNYDAVIMGHTQLEKLRVSKKTRENFIKKQIDEVLDGINEHAASTRQRTPTIKQLEATKKKLEKKLKELGNEKAKDDVIDFEELGVDYLFVDEAHNYKNLFVFTKMSNVSGVQTTSSQKAEDMFMKCRYLEEKHGTGRLVFATGTPISNSMVELFTHQRYLQNDLLKEMGLQHFDAWAANFGETTTALEQPPEGGISYRLKTRFAKFYNLPELMGMFNQVADIKTADTLNLDVPELISHVEVAPASEQQRNILEDLARRAQLIRNGAVEPTKDNMLKITNDGRKMALDQRLYAPELPDNKASKVDLCADKVYSHYQQGSQDKLTQLVFCDLSTPKANSFSVYQDLKDKLIERGILAEEVAFIHNHDKDEKSKEALFKKVRAGEIRVLLGSTEKMGAGTNVQERLIAIHDLDCPWRPSDLEQRLGRLVRQGNKNSTVHSYRYVTEGTFDAYMYQTNEKKQRFISQIMTSKTPARAAEDIDESVLTYAEIVAIATDNPLLKEKMELDIEVQRLKTIASGWQEERVRLKHTATSLLPNKISSLGIAVEQLKEDVLLAAGTASLDKDSFMITLKGVEYTDKKLAGAYILNQKAMLKKGDTITLGEYRGFGIDAQISDVTNDYQIILRAHTRHVVVLGDDPLGVITRLDNKLAGLSDDLHALEERLQNAQEELEKTRRELNKPFAAAGEIAEKEQRLADINAELGLDETEKITESSIIEGIEEECHVDVCKGGSVEEIRETILQTTASRIANTHEDQKRYNTPSVKKLAPQKGSEVQC